MILARIISRTKFLNPLKLSLPSKLYQPFSSNTQSPPPPPPPQPAGTVAKINFFFVGKDGTEIEVLANEGENILEIAHKNNIDLEGACEMSLACSTCHVILEDKIFQNIPQATESEEDMLDLAYGLVDTSRLGCQVKVTPLFNGTKVRLPKATRNFYVDGHKPKPH